MVSRGTPPEDRTPSAHEYARDAFGWWRRVLSRFLPLHPGEPAGTASRTAPIVLASFLTRPSATVAEAAEPELESLTALGAMLLLLGALAGLGLHLGLGRPFAAGLLDFAGSLLWALVRLVVIVALARDRSSGTRRRLMAAWGGGLAPYLLGVVPALRFAAFVVSAALTWTGLGGAASRREATRLTLWAYGGQAAVFVGDWLLRNAILFGLWFGTG